MSNATAVQIAHTCRGVQRIVEHLGSAHDDARLAARVAIALEKIAAMDGQGTVDLDALLPTPAATAAPTVTGSRSRVLWEVLEAAYPRLRRDRGGDVQAARVGTDRGTDLESGPCCRCWTPSAPATRSTSWS